jgi:peroxiredoxin
MLEVGSAAPDFTLRDQHGQDVTLSTLRGTKSVVLMFFPFAFSGVCTGELCEVREKQPSFDTDDSHLMAISCDPIFSLRALADRDALFFPLLSDFWPHGEVARSYGAFDEERGCATRSSFIVDKQGIVRWSVHNPMPEGRDLAEQLRVLAQIGA